MSDREKIIRYYKSNNDGDIAARLCDAADYALKFRRYKISDFLDPAAMEIAESIVAHYQSLELLLNGGSDNNERARAIFVHKEFVAKDNIGAEIVTLGCKWDYRHYQLTHRDVLGSILALGVKRELVGDIIIPAGDYGAVAFIDKTIAKLVIMELTHIGGANISVEVVPDGVAVQREERTKEIRATVASLRLDTIAAAGFGMSRTRMAAEIEAFHVKVNWKETGSPAHQMTVGDVISFRGRGRVEVVKIGGQTKKGRTVIELLRYI